jgi:hypothetical protein
MPIFDIESIYRLRGRQLEHIEDPDVLKDAVRGNRDLSMHGDHSRTI